MECWAVALDWEGILFGEMQFEWPHGSRTSPGGDGPGGAAIQGSRGRSTPPWAPGITGGQLQERREAERGQPAAVVGTGPAHGHVGVWLEREGGPGKAGCCKRLGC